MNQFYAYLWLRKDGTPYYAGKGVGMRAFTANGHRVYPPTDKSRILVMNRASEADALASEIELIHNWGRLDIGTGCLRNRTNGGDGISGYRHSEETKRKMRLSPSHERFRGYRHTNEARAKMSASRIGKMPPLACFAAGIAANTGRKRSVETCAKMALAWTPERREQRTRRAENNFLKTVAWG